MASNMGMPAQQPMQASPMDPFQMQQQQQQPPKQAGAFQPNPMFGQGSQFGGGMQAQPQMMQQ